MEVRYYRCIKIDIYLNKEIVLHLELKKMIYYKKQSTEKKNIETLFGGWLVS